MAYKCDMCEKGRMVGKQHRHHAGVAGNRWNRRAPKTQKIFKPNLHVARILINGIKQKMKLCTKCLRIARLAIVPARQAKAEVFAKKEVKTPVAATS